jgi:ABC-type Mn2+/Zn2+ transport system ATPase subunit
MPDPSLTNEDPQELAPNPGHQFEAMPALVRINGLTKSFGSKIALKHVTFSVPSGQICGLLGPNGAGKTTLFRLLMGILKATEGQLLIDGLDAFEDRVEVKRLIGFLPDEPVFTCPDGKFSNLVLQCMASMLRRPCAALARSSPNFAFSRTSIITPRIILAE